MRYEDSDKDSPSFASSFASRPPTPSVNDDDDDDSLCRSSSSGVRSSLFFSVFVPSTSTSVASFEASEAPVGNTDLETFSVAEVVVDDSPALVSVEETVEGTESLTLPLAASLATDD